MKFSTFGNKFARECGILQLMDDLGHALAEGGDDVIMLGDFNASLARAAAGLGATFAARDPGPAVPTRPR